MGGAWRAATNAAVPPNVAARTALKSITTLEDLHWKPLPAQPDGPDVGRINPGHYAHTGMVIGTTEAPRWREDAFVAVCNGGKRLVLFGGRDADHSIYFNDTWTCDLTTGEWLRVNPANIPSSDASTATLAADASSVRGRRNGRSSLVASASQDTGTIRPGFSARSTRLRRSGRGCQ